jgi:CheY-like chemotaxis protein
LRGSIPSTIDIREEIDTTCSLVLADPTGIHQILMNLCTNAYHAMQDTGGLLVLRLSEVQIGESEVGRDPELSPGCYVRLEVHDTGHGMDEETQARIFDPYFTTKQRGQGTGLGLATIHGIVTGLNGVIHVYSEPGTGSTFTVLLPCIRSEEATADIEPYAENLRGTERILLVDDEPPIGAFAQSALGRLGYIVTIETSALRAFERFANDPGAFDVVVTDQMMPHIKGVELSRRIHALRSDIPVILCSGFAEAIHDHASDSEDIQCHVMKPIIGADLARAIRRVCDSRNGQ